MKRFLSRTPLWGALLLGLTGLIACGQPQTPSTHNGTPTVDLLTATQNTAKSVQAIDVEKGQHVSRDELKAYWKTSNPLTAASINDISTSLVYVRDLTGQFAVVSYNTTNGVEQELFRTNSRIQSAGATGDGRFLAISALNPANGQYDIYRVHLISGTVERITSNTLDDLNVSITADGETIVWEAVQQPYVNGGGFSRITFRDWGTGTGIDYYLNSYASRREPTISADGTVISSVEKRPDQTFASISNYYTSGQFFYEVDRSYAAISHPSPSNGGHRVSWLEVASGLSSIKLNDVDYGTTRNFASSTSTLDHPQLNASGTHLVVAENINGKYQGTVIDIASGTQTAVGSPQTSNTAFAWTAGGTPDRTNAPSVLAEVSGTLTAGQDSRLTLPAYMDAFPELTTSAQLEDSVQVKFQRLTTTLPAPFPSGHIYNELQTTVVGNYRLLSSAEVTSAPQEMALPFNNPDQTRYDLVHLYAWRGDRYERIGGASPHGGYAPVAQYSNDINAPGYPQGAEIIAIGMNKAEFQAACTNRGGIFDGTSCDKAGDLSDGTMGSLGITDNKLTTLAINVGNLACKPPYQVKLCNFDLEIKVKTFLSARFPDLVLLSEVFNNDCGGVDFAKYVTRTGGIPLRVRSGSVCDSLEREHRLPLVHQAQIDRILPEGKYLRRCSEAKPLQAGSTINKYGGYECIALKKGFLAFRDTSPYLEQRTPICPTPVVTQSLSGQAVSPPASVPDRLRGMSTRTQKSRAKGGKRVCDPAPCRPLAC